MHRGSMNAHRVILILGPGVQHDEVAEELYVSGLQHEVQPQGVALRGTEIIVSECCSGINCDMSTWPCWRQSSHTSAALTSARRSAEISARLQRLAEPAYPCQGVEVPDRLPLQLRQARHLWVALRQLVVRRVVAGAQVAVVVVEDRQPKVRGLALRDLALHAMATARGRTLARHQHSAAWLTVRQVYGPAASSAGRRDTIRGLVAVSYVCCVLKAPFNS